MSNHITKTSPNNYTVFNTERQTKASFKASEQEAERVRTKFECSIVMPKELVKFNHFKTV